MKQAILSFDDGYEEDYTTAFPILKERGLAGTSYVVTNDIGRKGYLSWDQMKEMAKFGWDFQCHSHTHPSLYNLTDREIEKEMEAVDNEFMRHSMPMPEHHAYPFGRRNDRVKGIIKKYRKTARGIDYAEGDRYDIKPIDMRVMFLKDDFLFFFTHDVSDNHRGFGISVKQFKALIDFLKDYKIVTVKEYYENS